MVIIGKNPAFLFYPNDWLGDNQLQMTSTVVKGVWIQCLARMWYSPERGKLTGTKDQLCKILNCTPEEFEIFCNEASVTFFADVTKCNEVICVTNRRMLRDDKIRKSTKYRVRKYREKKCNASVTPASSVTVTVTNKNTISKGGNGKYPQEWYRQLEQEYMDITNRKPVGSGWGKIRATFKQLFEDGNTVADIIGCMKQCQKKYTDWYMPALINHMHEYKTGSKSSALDTLKAEAIKTRKEVKTNEAEF